MPLDPTLLKPAQIGTSEIATKFDISTSLAAYNPAEVINTNTTTIDGGKITTGSITADQIAANTITTNQIALGTGLVNGYVQSSDFTTMGGAGFRLKSNAAGTLEDPTIYGAYIRGGTIDSSTMNVRLLNLITDGGQSAYTQFSSSSRVYTGAVNYRFYDFNIYSYNSTDSTKNKLASASSTRIEVRGELGPVFIGLVEYSRIALIESFASCTVSSAINGVIISTGTFTGYGQSRTVSGIEFYSYDDGGTGYMLVRKDNSLILSGNGKFGIITRGISYSSITINVYNL